MLHEDRDEVERPMPAVLASILLDGVGNVDGGTRETEPHR
jgi:hypothetical protein